MIGSYKKGGYLNGKPNGWQMEFPKLWWCIQKRTICVRSKAEGLFGGRKVKERNGELVVFGRMEEDGEVTVWVEAAEDAGATWTLDAEAL